MNVASDRVAYGSLPNILSFSRLIGSPLLIPLANIGQRGWVLGWFLLMGLTDCLDGILARRRGEVTAFGSKLDGIADLVFYPCAAVVLAILFPAYLLPNLPYIAGTLLALAGVLLVSKWRCGKVILLHTHLARYAGVGVFLIFPASFVFDTTLAIRGVAMMYTLAFIEGMAIFMLRGTVSADTRSIFAGRIAIIAISFAISLSSIGTTHAQGTEGDEALRARMLKAGLLPGYLSPSTLPTALAFLPPPPPAQSAAESRDREANSRTLAEADSARRALAASDADMRFPGVTRSFACAAGIDIGETTTPTLYKMMRRTLADFGLASRPMKQHYLRPRPFMVNGQPSCTPQDEATLRTDGSYPSGHAAYGFGWSLMLASVVPEKTDALLRRGIDFGMSREVCNVHWRSDVEQARVLAAAVFARLQADAEFRRDLDAARTEVQTMRTQSSALPAGCAP